MDEKTKERNKRLAAELYPQPKKYDHTFWRVSQLTTSKAPNEIVIVPDYKGLFLLGCIIPIPFLVSEWTLWRLINDVVTIGGVLAGALVSWLFLTIFCFIAFSFIKAVASHLNTLAIPDIKPVLYVYLFFIAPIAVGLQATIGHDGIMLFIAGVLTLFMSSLSLITITWLLYKTGSHKDKRWRKIIYLLILPYLLGLAIAVIKLL